MRLPMLDRTGRRPLILGKGGFGRQLADWLRDDGWDEPLFLDDNAPGCAGKLRDYADPALLKPGRAAFVALGSNALRVDCRVRATTFGAEETLTADLVPLEGRP